MLCLVLLFLLIRYFESHVIYSTEYPVTQNLALNKDTTLFKLAASDPNFALQIIITNSFIDAVYLIRYKNATMVLLTV